MSPAKTAGVPIPPEMAALRRAWVAERKIENLTGEPGPSDPVLIRRVERLLEDMPRKIASSSGQDLRLPVLGGTKMPTDDSKSMAVQNLKSSQANAEVGSTPSFNSLKPTGPTVQDVTPKVSSSTAGSLPKIGYAMKNDPLIQYLRKQAEAMPTNEGEYPQGKAEKRLADGPPPEPEEVGDGGRLPTNKEDFPLGDVEKRIAAQDPHASDQCVNKSQTSYQDYLKAQFDAAEFKRKKYLDKDKGYSIDADVVDKFVDSYVK